MAYSIYNRHAPNLFKAFWARRAARILPVAWLLVLTYAVALAIRATFDLPAWDVWLLAKPQPPILSYATFTQNFFIAANGVEQPRWTGITWSLAIEEQFYVLFPFVVYFLRRRFLYLLIACGVAIAIALRAPLEAWYGNWYAPYIMLVTRMDALLLGVLVALIVRDDRLLAMARRLRYVLDVVIVMIVYAIATHHPITAFWPFTDGPVTKGPFPPLKHTILALMFALVILRIFLYDGGLFRAALRSRVLGWFGLISYALYMYHQAVNGMLHAYFFGDQPKVELMAQFGVAVAVMLTAVALAYLSFLWLETPIRRIGQRVSYTRAASVASSEHAGTMRGQAQPKAS